MLNLAVVALALGAATPVFGETVHGVVVYSRHGDRSTKHYGAQSLTNLGAAQNFQVGSGYRARYLTSGSPQRILNISEFNYLSTQVYASAPNQGILLNTATSFLQGLYPPQPILSVDALNNGSQSPAPLDGYQYVVLNGENADAPSSIWIKGRDQCTTALDAAKDFPQSAEFKAVTASTKDFYRRFYDILQPVYDYTSPDNMTYSKAYDIFDLINVARIHNATSAARNVSDADLFQLRTLSDSAEFGLNYNASQPARSLHGRTLIGGILNQLNQTVTSKGKLKFSLMAGSYDTFLAFFGVANLLSVSSDFYGMPDYASTLAFELFTASDRTTFPSDPAADLRVRFLFRNSTFGQLTAFPLFGTGQDSLPWPEFVSQMQSRAISTPKEYCSVCNSKATFCAAYRDAAGGTTTTTNSNDGGNSGGISTVVAGVIGAMVTLAVALIVGAVAFVLLRKKRAAAATTTTSSSTTGSVEGKISAPRSSDGGSNA